jgi:hypothetical protein
MSKEESKVWFLPARRGDTRETIDRSIDRLWGAADLASRFREHDLAALKLHVGEPGRTTFAAPPYAAALVRLMTATGARPFLTDSAVLYRSPRNNGIGHARVAADHGFTLDAVGAPFLPADGIDGSDEIELAVEGGRHFHTVSIAAAAARARSMLVLSHATGHLATGFGGALKNLGMGCSSRKAKLRQHFGQEPRIDERYCTGCGECAKGCPEDAISVNGTAAIEKARCIGCGACIARCLENAVRFDWTVHGAELQERIVEHAVAIAREKAGRIGYVTVAVAITKDCDCMDTPEEPLCEDIGLLASLDPVAIDAAALRLVRETTGRTLESMSYPEHDGSEQIRYAEKLGIGRADAEIVRLDE